MAENDHSKPSKATEHDYSKQKQSNQKSRDKSNDVPSDDLTTATSHTSSGEPQTIGNYKVLRKIGEGGMGAVYEAEQEKPVRRKVALKLIKWGMDTKSVVARFESERQALALMNHPNIAKVYDAGSTDQGRPYFVMEYVQGIPITQYCDTHRLTTKERLNLFISVCEAVQHAHQKGIIHRDIKASNVLVAIQDDKPVPKIIDFGVAKATASRLTEHTVYTEFGQLIGTPEYMSPEQAEMTGLDIDTRTDVYSLGVLLYELLVGAFPFDPRELRKSGFDEIRRKIREEEPSKPSTRVSTLGDATTEITEKRKTELPALQRQLKGDLDWITMKALEKDRTRRYQSALELSADINRHLNNEAVIASPPSTLYRMRKFVRRHKIGVAAGIIVSLALIVGIIGTTAGLIRATKAEAKAKEEAETAKKVSDFLVGLFEVSDPSEARGNTITAREILDKGSEKIVKELEDQPLVQARMMNTIGKVYRDLGLLDKAHPLLNEALTIRQNLLGEQHLDAAESMRELGELLMRMGDYKKAKPLLEKSITINDNILGPYHDERDSTLSMLAGLYLHLGDMKTALALSERALAIEEKIHGPEHPDVAYCLNTLAIVLAAHAQYDRARSLHERAIAIREKILGPDHPYLVFSIGNMGYIFTAIGKYEEALSYYERCLDIREKTFGIDHPFTAMYLSYVGDLYSKMGDLDKARLFLERSLTILEGISKQEHTQITLSLRIMAYLLWKSNRYEESRTLFERAIAIQERVLGPENFRLANTRTNFAELLIDLGELEEARSNFTRALSIYESTFGSEHPSIAYNLSGHAKLLEKTGNYETAQSHYERAIAIMDKFFRPDHPETAKMFYDYASLMVAQGNHEKALDLLRQSVERGFADIKIFEDARFNPLLNEPEFKNILSEIKKRMSNQ